MIKLIGGSLWQWDTGRKVEVIPKKGFTVTNVELFNRTTEGALPSELSITDGVLTADIPDLLLQTPNFLTVYATAIDESGRQTVESAIFEVRERVKPPNYENTDNMYILLTEDGQEIPAVVVEEKTVFDATANDIRIGLTAATDSGVTVGTKVIPSYNTTEGWKIIPAGSAVKLTSANYEYTKLQALICAFNTSLSNSVATEKVAINGNVYNVLSVDSLALIEKDGANTAINFGVTNDTDKPQILRYFYFKEIY